MKAYVYLHVSVVDNNTLLEKINELGYKANYCIRGDTYQVYYVEMDVEDLLVLRLCIPSLEVDIRDNE
jgi:hypothetical protein